MPVFGNRMVVATANVKHIAKVKKETDVVYKEAVSMYEDKEKKQEIAKQQV